MISVIWNIGMLYLMNLLMELSMAIADKHTNNNFYMVYSN